MLAPPRSATFVYRYYLQYMGGVLDATVPDNVPTDDLDLNRDMLDDAPEGAIAVRYVSFFELDSADRGKIGKVWGRCGDVHSTPWLFFGLRVTVNDSAHVHAMPEDTRAERRQKQLALQQLLDSDCDKIVMFTVRRSKIQYFPFNAGRDQIIWPQCVEQPV